MLYGSDPTDAPCRLLTEVTLPRLVIRGSSLLPASGKCYTTWQRLGFQPPLQNDIITAETYYYILSFLVHPPKKHLDICFLPWKQSPVWGALHIILTTCIFSVLRYSGMYFPCRHDTTYKGETHIIIKLEWRKQITQSNYSPISFFFKDWLTDWFWLWRVLVAACGTFVVACGTLSCSMWIS